jgi:D-alanyl-D-alanine carboxypeptidase
MAATTHRDDHGGLDTDVAFRIASVTKTMTATALLALADQGHCRLDDPTGRYLPGEVVDRFRDHTGRAYAAAITLRQLLDHTSGLPNSSPSPRSWRQSNTVVDAAIRPC